MKRSGMTLVEILFAFAIMTSVTTLSYAAGLRGWRTSQSGNQRTQAQYIAQDAIERVKAYRDSPNFKWSGAASLPSSPGTGGFLSDIDATGSSDRAFYVDDCTADERALHGCASFKVYNVSSSPDQTPSGHPAVKRPIDAQKVSDNTDFYVYLVVTQYFELDPVSGAATNTAKPGFPSGANLSNRVQAVSIDAHVEWTDASGNKSNAQASTILTDNINAQVANAPAAVPLPSSTIIISTPTPVPPTPPPTPTPIPATPNPACWVNGAYKC